MSSEVSIFEANLVGRKCQVGRVESRWAFDFGDGCELLVGCPWRLVSTAGIAVTSSDDGQWFGLSEPIDSSAKVAAILETAVVTSAAVNGATADLCLWFSNETRLEVINHSSGYEAWEAHSGAGDKGATIIGLGGGGLAIV